MMDPRRLLLAAGALALHAHARIPTQRDTSPIGKVEPVLPARQLHRNEACPCGSGKKWKRCCRGRRRSETA